MSGSVPSRCPSCGSSLLVVRLKCTACATEVTGQFDMCPTCRLDGEDRKLFDLFMIARGNVKQVQRALGVSYPTARQRVEDLFQRLGHSAAPPDPLTILRKVRAGEIDVEAAEALLRGTFPSPDEPSGQ